MSSLSDTTIRAAKPKEKRYRLYDERGLFLIVRPTGGKWWRWKYRFGGKETSISLGVYPHVSLKDARLRRDDAKKLLAAGINPSAERRAKKAARGSANSLDAVAREWHAKFSPRWTRDHANKIIGSLERDVLPWLGSRPIGEVTAPELLTVLRRIESRAPVIAKRGLSSLSRIFRYAVATGRAERDPTYDLRGALSPTQETHHPAITDPKLIGGLLRSIDGYQGSFITRSALKLAPLTFVRPGELRKAEWSDFDLEAAEWRIGAAKMKMRAIHIIPLSLQAVQVLRELHPLTGSGRYVFRGAYRQERPLSQNTLNSALHRLGYTDEMTAHGFRTMASTLLHEQGWDSDAIERQLAHRDRNAVRAAYSHAQHLPTRRRMIQAWADYLDVLRSGKVEHDTTLMTPKTTLRPFTPLDI
jgi:integrase